MTRWDAASQSGPDDFVIRAIRFGQEFENVTTMAPLWQNYCNCWRESLGCNVFGVALVEVQVKLVASLLQVHNPKDDNFPNKKNPIVDILGVYELTWLPFKEIFQLLSSGFALLPIVHIPSYLPHCCRGQRLTKNGLDFLWNPADKTLHCYGMTGCRASCHLVSHLHGCKSFCTMQLSYVQVFPSSCFPIQRVTQKLAEPAAC